MYRIEVQIYDSVLPDARSHTLTVVAEAGIAATTGCSFIDAFRDAVEEREKATFAEQQNRLLKSERSDVVIERNDHEVG